jgi:polysaccharide export outer membrane protein
LDIKMRKVIKQHRRMARTMSFTWSRVVLASILLTSLSASAMAQTATAAATNAAPVVPAPAPKLPSDYIIGVEDILSVVFWRDKDLSADVVVRPDGKISLPILNDVPAAGMTPEALAAAVSRAATKYVRDAGATVIVKEIRSRKIHVIGEVARPGPFSLGAEMNVLQALGEAGGFIEGADKGDVIIVRTENGKERRFKFDYNEVVKGKKLAQNIRLLPGDTIIVH